MKVKKPNIEQVRWVIKFLQEIQDSPETMDKIMSAFREHYQGKRGCKVYGREEEQLDFVEYFLDMTMEATKPTNKKGTLLNKIEKIEKARESYENDLLFCGVNYDDIDYEKLAVAREKFDLRIRKLIKESKEVPK